MDHDILALIPARSGSKSLIHKNIRLLQGKPMLAYSIEHALACPGITRCIVSTDSEEYAEIARSYGAETPFLRPREFSGDFSTDLELFRHALDWLLENEGYKPDICVHLRPTHPIRNVDDIAGMIELLLTHPEADSVRSVVEAPATPYKMWSMDGDGFLTPVVETDIKDAYNLPRQNLPETYLQNASIDVVRASVILNKGSMTGDTILGYRMSVNYDIDTERQFHQTEEMIRLKEISTGGAKTFCFDIDGVVAALVLEMQYDKAEAKKDIISIINYLYDQGHRIILFTARGTLTGIDWSDETKRQLAEWGVKYHELLFGKPAADYYIDDRMLSMTTLSDFFNRHRITGDKNNEREKKP